LCLLRGEVGRAIGIQQTTKRENDRTERRYEGMDSAIGYDYVAIVVNEDVRSERNGMRSVDCIQIDGDGGSYCADSIMDGIVSVKMFESTNFD
jgi:hypothetical protein